ncbi:LuxR C-terminal-related transcriptional regulator [Nocardia salmonicida]|uniref:LuxR C-terminal-related transcriptional regulator n=1 Tax=Nocardia salmonicida TaxID=53431 RepID=UPI00365A9742
MPDGTDRVLVTAVIDDHPVLTSGIAISCAEAYPPIELAASYSSPTMFLDDPAATPDAFDVVILDLQFNQKAPDLAALTMLCHRGFRVVVYSRYHDSDLVLDCLELGAAIYLSKEEPPERLIAALRAASIDQAHVTATMAQAMAQDRRSSRPSLSSREREVLLAWFQTESKALVGQRLHITAGTVSTHLERIRTKYAAAGRPAPTKAALVARAIQDNLVEVGDL